MMRAIAALATASLTALAVLGEPVVAQPNPAASPQKAVSPSTAGLDMAAVPKLDSEGVRQVQQALHDKSFDPGPIDGVLGPQTKEAVRKFQDFYGIKATGEIDNQTLYALGVGKLAGQP